MSKMNRKWKIINYLISTVLGLAALLTVFCIWRPFLSAVNTPLPMNDYEVPMRAVGINMPAVVVIGGGLAAAVLILFLLAKRRSIPKGFLWVNVIAILIIAATIFMLLVGIHPFGH
ncbi:MAG: hypothetical protein ABRQ24_03855 [Syntrophomonadaceae bacterium]